ncbi:MAG: protein translocase subunit SecD [Leptospirales bacterium]|nr:protein translocase subunit SecD [Leptospirales bacterium]
MTRRMLYKLIFIVFLILLAATLILPTVAQKKMQVVFSDAAAAEQKNAVKDWFRADNFTIEKDEGSQLIVAGRAITDAVKNEIKGMQGVDDAVILKHWVEEKFLSKKINFGLDLQGGVHLVLQANYSKIIQKYSDDIKSIDQKLAESGIADDEKKRLKDDRDYITNTVLEEHVAAGNMQYVIREKYKTEVTRQALELLRGRVDKFGVAEPSIRPTGNDAIEIQLPGLKDIESVKNAIGSTGSLEYRLVDDAWTSIVKTKFEEKARAGVFPEDWAENSAFLDSIILEIKNEISLPDGLQTLFMYEKGKDTPNPKREREAAVKYDKSKSSQKIYAEYPLALEKQAVVNGTDISEATVNHDEYGQIVVSFRTTAEGALKFANATREENRGKRLAIVLDDKIRSAPNINDNITTGSGQISGGFNYEEAMTLTRVIKEGALPVDLNIIEERIVGPSLGKDSIESGVRAVLIGVIGIMIFMFIYYRGGGLIANFGLCLNLLFMLALLSLLGATLTLPGIAGFVLTVGMAIDANIIIYERIKEEKATGKSYRRSVLAGFERGFDTILDSNLTTLIAAFVLLQFGTGPIKGFAVTLLIGIISSMFTVLYITRFIYEIISLNKKVKKENRFEKSSQLS